MLIRYAVFLIFASSTAAGLAQQDSKSDSERMRTLEAFQRLLDQSDDDIAALAKATLSEDGFDAMYKRVSEVRQHVKGIEASDVIIHSRTQGQLIYETLSNVVRVDITMSTSTPYRVDSVSYSIQEDENADRSPLLSWETLGETLRDAAENGFEGGLLVTRNGEIVFHHGYGFANQEKRVKNSTNTIFAIGSAPIDFTHAGILLLKDQNKLRLDDLITKYFDDVPTDKQAITIRHLMNGGSGLPDFHDTPSDKNPDHSWIDREEAIKRILAQDLLFQPGKDREHSHSAWGMLAAIIEIVSEETYQQFTKERLFKPAGMVDTGFFGDEVPVDRIAVGYGHMKSSTPNSPPHWGTTSWLVMGSGGQISTLEDMYRWAVAMRNESILSPESTKIYLAPGDGVSSDGDMFGFEFMHSQNPESMFLLISNSVGSHEERSQFEQLGRRLFALTRPAPTASYSLGLAMAYHPNQGVSVQQTVAGGAAEQAGLQVGDILKSVNGKELGDPRVVMLPLLTKGAPLDFGVLRDGKLMDITVTPQPKDQPPVPNFNGSRPGETNQERSGDGPTHAHTGGGL